MKGFNVSVLSVAIMSAIMVTGCASKDKSGYYWFANDDAPTPTARTMVNPPEGSGLGYRPDSRDIEMYREQEVARGYRDPLQTGFAPMQTHKMLTDYAAQLAMELMEGSNQLSEDDLIGIASFVRLNTTLQEPTVMGNQLAEYMISELQEYGLAIVDFKLANTLTITPYGDLAMTRKGKNLAKNMSLDHILTGTLVELPRGVKVNARIVSTRDHRVVASASLFVPAFMVTALNTMPSLVSE
jgi:TolB-like protein